MKDSKYILVIKLDIKCKILACKKMGLINRQNSVFIWVGHISPNSNKIDCDGVNKIWFSVSVRIIRKKRVISIRIIIKVTDLNLKKG